ERVDAADRGPHHRRARLGRSLDPGRCLPIAAIGSEKSAANSGQHDLLTGERNAGEPPAAVTRGLADENHPWASDFLEIELEIAPPVRISAIARRVLIAGSVGDLHA